MNVDSTVKQKLAKQFIAFKVIEKLHREGVIDNDFLPPLPPMPIFSSFRRKKRLAQEDAEGDCTDLLWREASVALSEPEPYTLTAESIETNEDGCTWRFVAFDADSNSATMPPQQETCQAAAPTEAAATTHAECSPRDRQYRTLYPHHIFHEAESWNSETLVSGGLFGFGKLLYNPKSGDLPPRHMLRFIQKKCPDGKLVKSIMTRVKAIADRLKQSAAEEQADEESGTEDSGSDSDTGDLFAQVPVLGMPEDLAGIDETEQPSKPVHLLAADTIRLGEGRKLAVDVGKAALLAMDECARGGDDRVCAEENAQSHEKREHQERGCCMYPSLRFSNGNPWSLLQPSVLVLSTPLPEPLHATFAHSETNEPVHVTIRPITVKALERTNFAESYTSNLQTRQEIEKTIKSCLCDRVILSTSRLLAREIVEGGKGDLQSDRDEAGLAQEREHGLRYREDDLATCRQPLSWEIPEIFHDGLQKLCLEMRRVWSVKNFAAPGHSWLQGNSDSSLFTKTGSTAQDVLPAYTLMAPLASDGVSLDLNFLMRVLPLMNFARSANTRKTFETSRLDRIIQNKPPTYLELFKAAPEAMICLDPNVFNRVSSRTEGISPVGDRTPLSLSNLFCPHMKAKRSQKEENEGTYIRKAGLNAELVNFLGFDSEDLKKCGEFLFFDDYQFGLKVSESHEDVQKPSRLCFHYPISDFLKQKYATVFGQRRSERLMFADHPTRRLALILVYHILVRGAESPLLRMIHEEGRAFHYYRMDGHDWANAPHTRFLEDSEVTLEERYRALHKREVSAENNFLVIGSKTRQGSRLCFTKDTHVRRDPYHAPEFVLVLPFSEVNMGLLSSIFATYWSLDVQTKQLELKYKLDLTLSRSMPRVRALNHSLEDKHHDTHVVWRWQTGNITLLASSRADFEVSRDLLNKATTTISGILDESTEIQTLVDRGLLFDYLFQEKGEKSYQEMDGGRGDAAIEQVAHKNKMWEVIRDVYSNHAFEASMQMLMNSSHMASQYALFSYFPTLPGRKPYNQVLEFVGDAILKYVAAVWSFFALPEGGEGDLSMNADSIKSNKALRRGMRHHKLHTYLLCRSFGVKAHGRGMQCTIPDLRAQKVSYKQQADLAEALIGGIYWSHYHRMDMFPNLSDEMGLKLATSKMREEATYFTLDQYKALMDEHFYHPSWCGSAGGAFACAMFIDKFILTDEQRKSRPLLFVFSLLRDLSAQSLVTPLRSKGLPDFPSLEEVFADTFEAESVLGQPVTPVKNPVLLRSIWSDKKFYTETDLKQWWPANLFSRERKRGYLARAETSLETAESRGGRQEGTEDKETSNATQAARSAGQDTNGMRRAIFVDDNPVIFETMKQYFPSSFGRPQQIFDFDTTLCGACEKFCDEHAMRPRASNRDFLSHFYAASNPTKVPCVRSEVYQHLCSARIHPNAVRQIHPASSRRALTVCVHQYFDYCAARMLEWFARLPAARVSWRRSVGDSDDGMASEVVAWCA